MLEVEESRCDDRGGAAETGGLLLHVMMKKKICLILAVYEEYTVEDRALISDH